MWDTLADPACPLRRVVGRKAIVEEFDAGQVIMPERGLRVRASNVEIYIVIAAHRKRG